MFKLTAVVRNHFVVVPHVEEKAPWSRSLGPTLVSIMASGGVRTRFPSIVVSKVLAALRTPIPDSSMVSLAGKAPTVCPQLRRMGR